MKDFVIKGSFTPGRKYEKLAQKEVFTRVVNSHNENTATNKLYSLFGAEHRIKRNRIKIESITEA